MSIEEKKALCLIYNQKLLWLYPKYTLTTVQVFFFHLKKKHHDELIFCLKYSKNILIFTEELQRELSFAKLKSWGGICAMNYVLPSYPNVTLKGKKNKFLFFFLIYAV